MECVALSGGDIMRNGSLGYSLMCASQLLPASPKRLGYEGLDSRGFLRRWVKGKRSLGNNAAAIDRCVGRPASRRPRAMGETVGKKLTDANPVMSQSWN